MTDITPIDPPKPHLEIEIRGKHHTGKSAVAAVVAKALREHFPGHKIHVISTDGNIKEVTAQLEEDPITFQERLKNAGNIHVLDMDSRLMDTESGPITK